MLNYERSTIELLQNILNLEVPRANLCATTQSEGVGEDPENRGDSPES
jgi:hypothetical protein